MIHDLQLIKILGFWEIPGGIGMTPSRWRYTKRHASRRFLRIAKFTDSLVTSCMLLSLRMVGSFSALQWGRARQGKVPDFMFLLSTPDGLRPSLAELKIISAGKTWYPRGVKGKGTSMVSC